MIARAECIGPSFAQDDRLTVRVDRNEVRGRIVTKAAKKKSVKGEKKAAESGETQEPVNLQELRERVRRVVADQAEEMTKAAAEEATKGHAAQLKYLFEGDWIVSDGRTCGGGAGAGQRSSEDPLGEAGFRASASGGRGRRGTRGSGGGGE
jgi:hypothetical protein